MKRILVTNDDGVRSEGIHALALALTHLGEVTVVGPQTEASAIGHALTLRRPLRMERLDERIYEVDGTPTDCVNIAITQLYKPSGLMPDVVVSGINKGYNLGDDVTYSGTVAGALEAALLGIPGVAVSQQRALDTYDFIEAAAAGAHVTELVLKQGIAPRTFLNVNVPKGIPKGFKRTLQGKRNHITKISERMDPRGTPYYWIEEGIDQWTPHDHSDYWACKQGFISVTLLSPDMTAHESLAALEKMPLDVPQETSANE